MESLMLLGTAVAAAIAAWKAAVAAKKANQIAEAHTRPALVMIVLQEDGRLLGFRLRNTGAQSCTLTKLLYADSQGNLNQSSMSIGLQYAFLAPTATLTVDDCFGNVSEKLAQHAAGAFEYLDECGKCYLQRFEMTRKTDAATTRFVLIPKCRNLVEQPAGAPPPYAIESPGK